MRRHSLLVSLLAVILMAGSGITETAAGSKIRGHNVRGGGGSSHHGHHHGYSGYGARTYIGVGYGYGYGYYGYYPGVAYYAAPYPWYGAPTYAGVYSAPAYVDTDVSPEEAAVFIDGEYVGIADSFDGFPRYLTIEPGRHTMTLKLDGYRTWTRTLRVPAGGITKLRIDMMMGEGIDAGDPRDVAEPAEDDEPIESGEVRGELEIAPDDGEGPAFVRLNVSPPQAAVYLDGRFYAPASTLDKLHGDLRLESGAHVIEAAMPGYETGTRRIELAPGDRLTLSIELRKAD